MSSLLRDNLDEKGGGDQSFEAAADSGYSGHIGTILLASTSPRSSQLWRTGHVPTGHLQNHSVLFGARRNGRDLLCGFGVRRGVLDVNF
jgi:hypothetical protein